MKKLILTTIAGLMALQLTALADEAWHTDFAKAQAEARKGNKLILMDFMGSDWCGPCIRLKKEVFDSKEFTDYATKNLVLLEVDFPRSRKQSPELAKANVALQKKYNVDGFPTIVILNGEGKEVLRSVGYTPGGPKPWIAKLDGVKKK